MATILKFYVARVMHASQEHGSNLGGKVCEGISQGGADQRRIPETSRDIRTRKGNATVG